MFWNALPLRADLHLMSIYVASSTIIHVKVRLLLLEEEQRVNCVSFATVIGGQSDEIDVAEREIASR